MLPVVGIVFSARMALPQRFEKNAWVLKNAAGKIETSIPVAGPLGRGLGRDTRLILNAVADWKSTASASGP